VASAQDTGGLVPFSSNPAAAADGLTYITGPINDRDVQTAASSIDTVTFWFRSTQTATSGILVDLVYSAGVARRIWLNGGKIQYTSTTGGGVYTQTSEVWADGATHFVAIDDNSPANIYVDGVAAAVTNGVASWVDQKEPSVTFAGGRGGDRRFEGDIDEVAVWLPTLTSTEIGELYDAAVAPWDGDTTGTRIGRILDAVEWPAGDRALASGKSVLGPQRLDMTALAAAQQINKAEAGWLYVAGDGAVTFLDRHATIVDQTVDATFGDGNGTELPYFYEQFEFAYDRDQIRNSARGRRTGGTDLAAEDVTSIAAYLRRDINVGELPVRDDNELKSRLEWLVYLYKDPALRVERIQVKPSRSPNAAAGDTWTSNQLWAATLGADMSQRFRVLRRPQGVGSAVDTQVICEGVHHAVGVASQGAVADWTTTLYLSPAPPNFWIWGTSEWGESADPTTRWGY
jgi:hypothetical protein